MRRHWAEVLHIFLPIFFLVLAGIFSSWNTSRVFEPYPLLPILNTVLLGALPLIIAAMAATAYARQSSSVFLLFGCSMVAFGLSSLISGWGLHAYGTNFTTALHDTGCLIAGLCNLGAVWTLIFKTTAKPPQPRQSPIFAFGTAYAAVALLLLAVSLLSIVGSFPTFFVEDDGPTLIRQLTLTLAAIAYAVSAVLLFAFHFQTGARFFALYADGLLLVSIGLAIVLTERNVGNLMGWVGRTAQYAGSVYLFVGLRSGSLETRKFGSTLPTYLEELFRSKVDDEVKVQTRELVALNKKLVQEVRERKLVEEKLRRSEERLRLAAEATGFGVYMYSFETGEPYYSPELLHLFGLPPGAPLPVDRDLVATALHPDDRPVFLSHMNAANDPHGPGILDLTYRITRADGQERWLRTQGRTSFCDTDRGPRPFQANGIVQDVTERRLVQEKIRESEESHRAVIENLTQGISIIQDGRIVLCNEALCRMNGYSKEETYRMTTEDITATIHPEDRERAVSAMGTILAGGDPPSILRVRLFTRHGHLSWVEMLSSRTTFKSRPALQIAYMDVTERYAADAALRESEERFRALLEHAPVAIGVARAGVTVYCNAAYLRTFGIPALDDVLDRPLTDQVAPQCREAVVERTLRRSRGEPAEAEYEMTGLRRDGTQFPCFVSSTLLTLPDGPATLAFLFDLTAQKVAEEKLKDSRGKLRSLAIHLLHAREEERKNVAREIHDELGQILTALKMDVQWIEKRVAPRTSAVLKKISGVVGLADQTIQLVHRISSELRPGMLDDLGLAAAIEWLAGDFSRRNGIPCSVDVAALESRIGGNSATALFRIIQEALTNVARHARASHASVELWESDGALVIRVHDDGRGITEQQSSAQSSFGIIGIRERVEGLGGQVLIAGRPREGTTLQVTIPLPPEGALV